MVLLENVTVGQDVEVNFGNKIYKGKVKYKGGVQGKIGEWVGVALEEPVGDNNGCLMGRTYFGCKKKHGIFVDASRIRFRPMIRWTKKQKTEKEPTRLYDRYLKTCDSSNFDPTLFKENERPMTAPSQLPQPKGLDFPPVPKQWVKKSYNKPQLIGRQIAKVNVDPEEDPIYKCERAIEFCKRPTMPNYYMPHELQQYHLKHGWGNTKLIRHSSARNYRDTIHHRQWNDVTL